MRNIIQILHLAASISLIALIFLCLTWALWLAPLGTNDSLLLFKTLPLLAPLFGILRGKRYTYQWASMLILIYFVEGIVMAWSDSGILVTFAISEIVLSFIFFLSAIFYARLTRKPVM